MLRLLTKTLGKTFFSQHAGFFLFIFYMIFGAVEPSQLPSYCLALFLSVSASFLVSAIFCAIIVLYALKSFAFVRLKINLPTYTFIKIMAVSPTTVQKSNWLGLYLIILSPILIFTLLAIIVGVYYGHYLYAMGIVSWCILVVSFLVWRTSRQIIYAFKEPIRLVKITLPVFKKPYVSWKAYYLLKQQTILLIGCKVISLLLFKGIIWALGDTDNSLKVYFIALLGSLLTHSVLIASIHSFEKSQLSFTRALPIASWKRFLDLTGFFAFIFIPELLLFGRETGLAPLDLLSGICFIIGGALTLYYSLYYFRDDMYRYLKFIFFFFIIIMLIILFNVVLICSLALFILLIVSHRQLCENYEI